MTDANQHDEDALLIAARSGAHEFAAFYRHFERSMLGFFVNAAGRSDLAADLTAETIARLASGHEDASLALVSPPNEQRQAIEARILDEREYPDIAHSSAAPKPWCASASAADSESSAHEWQVKQ